MAYDTDNSQTPKYPATDLTFGVEIETNIPNDSPVRIGSYRRGIRTPLPPTVNGTYWTAKSDCSISARSGRKGCEFVSPILQGVGGLENLRFVVRTLRTEKGERALELQSPVDPDTTDIYEGIGAQVNSSCGVHIHVGLPTNLNRKEAAYFLKRIAFLVGKVEHGIYASTGSHSRENGTFCHSIKERVRTTRWSKNHMESSRGGPCSSRFYGLNLTNLTGLGHGYSTVEFRYFSGSLNPNKIVAWVQMCVALVQLALSPGKCSQPNVRPAARCIGGAGDGGRELTRLFHTIGWTKGCCRYGGLGDFGEDYPIKAAKKELRRLAKKYDFGQ